MQSSEQVKFYKAKRLRVDKIKKSRDLIIKEIYTIDSVISSLLIFKPLSWDSMPEHDNSFLTYADLWNNKIVTHDEAIIVFQGLCETSFTHKRQWDRIICFCLFNENGNFQITHYQIDDISAVITLQIKCLKLIEEMSSPRSNSFLSLMHLSEYLIQPILSHLPDRVKKLTIMGNDEFQFVPWSTIYIGEDPDTMDLRWLVDSFTTRIAPSLSLLSLLNQREDLRYKNPTPRFLISGVALDPKQIEKYLYWSDYEINSIAKLYNTESVKDRAVDNLFAEEFERAEIIHFSGHANYHQDKSLDALDRTYLCLYEKQLSAAEILNGALKSSTAKSMILSACLTGRGDLIGAGNEILGLERALFYSGLSALVTTLWEVDEFSTAILMVKFHSIWKQHDNSLDCLATSLMTAQIWLRNISWYDLKQEMCNLDNAIEKCIETYSTLLKNAHSKNDESTINSLTKTRQRYVDLSKYGDHTIPFQHPYYWAAFQVKGIG